MFWLHTHTHTHLYNARAYDCQDEVEPDVGEDAPECSNKEDSEVFNLPYLSFRYHPHTHSDYHKHVKCSTADYGAGTQFSWLKTMSTHLSHTDREQRYHVSKAGNHLSFNIKYVFKYDTYISGVSNSFRKKLSDEEPWLKMLPLVRAASFRWEHVELWCGNFSYFFVILCGWAPSSSFFAC